MKTEIFQELIKSLERKDFDLDAWKLKATLLLKKVFGADDEKIELIQNIHYDYSSWSLRDNSGGKQNDSAKNRCREIMETAILELKLEQEVSPLLNIIKNELKGSEFEELEAIIAEKAEKEALFEFMNKLSPETKTNILAEAILKNT